MHDYVVESLRGERSEIERVALDTKISKWTLLKILHRQIKNPGIKSVEPLYKYFKDREGKKLRRRAA
jgi:hypothetical protein